MPRHGRRAGAGAANEVPLSGSGAMAGNTSTPGSDRDLPRPGPVGAFDQRAPALCLTELADRADLPLPTAHRLVGELVEWGALPASPPGATSSAAAVGRRPARSGPDRAAAAGVPVPARPLRRDPGHRAPRGPRPYSRCSTSTG